MGPDTVDDVGAQSELFRDATLAHAVSNIEPRSEREADDSVLERTYVDTGILPQLNNSSNQILYGRRGTGKSHVLRMLGIGIEAKRPHTTIYVDVRLLGSAQLMTDTSRSLAERCVSVFRDLLGLIQSQLLDIATNPASSGRGMQEVSDFADVVRSKSVTIAAREVETAEGRRSASGASLDVSTTAAGLKLASEGERTGELRTKQVEAFRETVVFAEVAGQLDKALAALEIESLYVLIDEWTSIPVDIQPFIAEFLKRALLPSRRITVKIASLEYRSRFSLPGEAGTVTGFELGPDISANLDLDDYYVYDRNPAQVVEMFLELLFKHISAELPEEYFQSRGIKSAVAMRARMFTEPRTFVELVRAGEGVVRDFIGVFTGAFFRAVREGKPKIDFNAVEEAARSWYETDKSVSLSDGQRTALHRIVNDVIGARQAKMFMLAREHAENAMVQSLFDQRLIHLILRGYSDKENPGLRYNIYSLDYGSYVDLKRTKAEPEDFLDLAEFKEMEPDRVIPFADKRSIRRIILDPKIFDDLS